MDRDLCRKILTEAATIPQINSVCFTGLGEPLIDQYLEERIAFARKLCPEWVIDVYTAGTHLTNVKAVALADAGLTNLYVSLNAVSAEKRLAIMGLPDFDKVVEQIRYATAIGKYRVVVKAVSEKDLFEMGENEIFMAMWGDFREGGQGFLHQEGNWAGETYLPRITPTAGCSRALGQIMVLWDGRVSLCCFDGEGKEILGDLRTQTIREVYNGPHATGIREAHFTGKRASIPICAGCTGI